MMCVGIFFLFLLIPVMHLSLWFLEAGFVGVKSSGNEDDHFDRLSQVREAIRQKRCEERGQTYIPPNEVSGTQEYVIQVSAKSATQNLVFSKIGSSWQKINAMAKMSILFNNFRKRYNRTRPYGKGYKNSIMWIPTRYRVYRR